MGWKSLVEFSIIDLVVLVFRQGVLKSLTCLHVELNRHLTQMKVAGIRVKVEMLSFYPAFSYLSDVYWAVKSQRPLPKAASKSMLH